MMPAGWLEVKLAYLDSLGMILSLGNVFLDFANPCQPNRKLEYGIRSVLPASRIVDRLFRGTHR